MLSAEGCQRRRERMWQQVDPKPEGDYLLLADPIHLMYLANFWIDPFSLGTDFGAFLLLRKDGHATLIHDKRSPKSVEQAHADGRHVMNWYDGQSPGKGPRQLALLEAALSLVPTPKGPLRVHDRAGDPSCLAVVSTLAAMRRQKDSDEVDLLRRCMRATEAGHAWARNHIQPGMTELDVYCGVNSACIQSASQAVIVYGDFAVSPGPERRGGPPTSRVL